MRRYQVLIESNFPSEAGVMLRNLENRGNPWGVSPSTREDWMKELDFEVRQADGPLPLDVEYLFWVGCAGAIDDRAKKVTKDRKSTRLNSSHANISYAVFCLKKKKFPQSTL